MELIKSISIENLVSKRDGAVARLRALFAEIDLADTQLDQLCGSSLRSIVGHRECSLFDGESGIQAAIKKIDAGIWAKLLLESGIRSFMASGDREKWDRDIMNCEVAEVTLDNVHSTFATLYAARGEMFIDGVVAVFRGLSWDHKTNSPMAFGQKLILANLWTDKGSFLSSRRCDTLDDLVRALCKLDGKPEPDVRNGMRHRIYSVDHPQPYWDEEQQKRITPEWSDVLEDDYLTLKWFKKTGTAHVKFKRPDLVDKLNLALGSRFPDAIATDVRNPHNRPKAVPVPELRPISREAITALRAMRAEGNVLVGMPQVDRGIYEEIDRIFSCLGGEWSRSAKGHVFKDFKVESMPYVLSTLLRKQAYADYADFSFFPSTTSVVEKLMELAELAPGMRVLEPSAGRGAIVQPMRALGCIVQAYELMDSNVDYLRSLGCRVSQEDFLELSLVHSTENGLYDAVVMNPPFEQGASILHVMHAYAFLKPGGRLVSVMPAGVKFNSDKYSQHFRQFIGEVGELIDLPPGSFKESGTMINTVVAVINKPDPALQLKAAPAAQAQPIAQLELV